MNLPLKLTNFALPSVEPKKGKPEKWRRKEPEKDEKKGYKQSFQGDRYAFNRRHNYYRNYYHIRTLEATNTKEKAEEQEKSARNLLAIKARKKRMGSSRQKVNVYCTS